MAHQEIKLAQQEDPFLGPLVVYLQNGKLNGTKNQKNTTLSLSDNFALIDDMPFRVSYNKRLDDVWFYTTSFLCY